MRRRTFLAGAAAASAAAFLPTRAVAAPRVSGAIATGLDIPWGLDFLPDRSALVTERDSGRLLRITPEGAVTTVATVPGVTHGGEGGLLGLAVSPGYATDQRIYLYHSTDDDNRVGWATYDGTTLSALTYVVTGIPHGTIHNGGSLLFGRDNGLLYIGCGETGVRGLAQDLTSLGGKILRVNRDGTAAQSPTGRDPRIVSWGHRNPQGLATWKGSSTEVWVAELGQNTWDELNHLMMGHNYGWPISEGGDGKGGYTDPFTRWHPANCSPSGMAIKGNTAYICALRGQSLWSVDIHGSRKGRRVRSFQDVYGRMRNVKVAADVSLWVTTSNGSNGDKVLRVVV